MQNDDVLLIYIIVSDKHRCYAKVIAMYLSALPEYGGKGTDELRVCLLGGQ